MYHDNTVISINNLDISPHIYFQRNFLEKNDNSDRNVLSDPDFMQAVLNILFCGRLCVCFQIMLPQMFKLCIANIFLYLIAFDINMQSKNRNYCKSQEKTTECVSLVFTYDKESSFTTTNSTHTVKWDQPLGCLFAYLVF